AQLFAGPFMNFVLAIVIFILIGLFQGVPTDKAVIGSVMDDSPAEEAGFESGDEVVRINGSSISTWEEFHKIVTDNPKKELSMTVLSDNSEEMITVVPEELEEQGQKFGRVGVRGAVDKSIGKALTFGFVQPYEMTKLILTNLGMLITGQVSIDMLS